MKLEDMEAVVADCKFRDYALKVATSRTQAVYLRGSYLEADTITGKTEMQYTRRWLLSSEMTKSEIVATAFKCVLTSMEHQAREWFTYKAAAIYHPHYDVDALVAICEKREVKR